MQATVHSQLTDTPLFSVHLCTSAKCRKERVIYDHYVANRDKGRRKYWTEQNLISLKVAV